MMQGRACPLKVNACVRPSPQLAGLLETSKERQAKRQESQAKPSGDQHCQACASMMLSALLFMCPYGATHLAFAAGNREWRIWSGECRLHHEALHAWRCCRCSKDGGAAVLQL